MTFNEWWAGQQLPESSRGVALAAWYACQLYGEKGGQDGMTFAKQAQVHTHQHVLDAVPHEAHGYQLDAIGEQLGVERKRSHCDNTMEPDNAYRARLRQKHRENTGRFVCTHEWGDFETFGGRTEERCIKCGERPL